MGAFGEKLRKQREQRGIELDAISNTTKISTRMLRALEDEHFDQLPGGVFNKGFVRAYARQVGLDEEEAVSDYLTALRESQIQQQSILPEFRDVRDNVVRNDDGRKQDLRGSDLRSHSPAPGSNDHRAQLAREDRRKQGRRDEDRRNPDPRSNIRRDNDPRDLARRDDVSRPQNKDLPPRLAPAMPAPALDPTRERFPKKYPAGSPEQPTDGPSAQIPWGRLAVALLLVTLALTLWSSHRRSEPGTRSRAAAAAQPSPPPGPAPVAPTSSPASRPSGSVSSPKPGKSSPTETISAATTPPPPSTSPKPPGPAAPPPSAQAASPAPSSTASTTTPANKPGASPPVASANSPVAKTTPPAAPAKPPASFTLLIRAEKTTWVSIIADGKPVAEETLIAPAHTSVRATGEVVVRAGNAAGVSFLLNGKEIPAQGNEGEVRTYTFDATGVRAVPPTDPNR